MANSSVRTALVCAALSLLGASLTAAASPAATPGYLLLVGGGGEPDALWTKFFELVGGKDAAVVVLPTASERPEAGTEYADDLRKIWGATHVQSIELRTRADASRPEFVAALAAARGIFFTGGDQVRITEAILATPAYDAIRRVYESGGVLSGTSAGTACMSSVMITGEGDFNVIRGGAVETKQGLGFITDAIVDQHFLTRQRENRLFTVVMEHPDLPGLGLDEGTAVLFKPDHTLEVVSEGTVMVIDGSAMTARSAVNDDKHRLGGRDLKVHFLLKGDGYDIARRLVLPAKP